MELPNFVLVQGRTYRIDFALIPKVDTGNKSGVNMLSGYINNAPCLMVVGPPTYYGTIFEYNSPIFYDRSVPYMYGCSFKIVSLWVGRGLLGQD